MTNPSPYSQTQPTRAEIDALRGAVVVEFGTDWCSHCRGAQPLIEQAWQSHPKVARVKVEDGPGRPLGRSFGVKLWPTLVFMRDGVEVARSVRPADSAEVVDKLASIDA